MNKVMGGGIVKDAHRPLQCESADYGDLAGCVGVEVPCPITPTGGNMKELLDWFETECWYDDIREIMEQQYGGKDG